MVGYSTDGEGTDWMFGEKEIISFSPELGSLNSDAQTFYLPKDLIFEVIQENYKVVDLFLNKNVFEVTEIDNGFMNNEKLVIEFKNKGLTNLISPEIIIKTESDFINNI